MNETTTITAELAEYAEITLCAVFATAASRGAKAFTAEPAEYGEKTVSALVASSALIVVSCAPCS